MSIVISGLLSSLNNTSSTTEKQSSETKSKKNITVLLEKLEESVMNGGSDESSGTQFIVFVKTIEVAKQLKELLASERAYKCEHLIGTRGDYQA